MTLTALAPPPTHDNRASRRTGRHSIRGHRLPSCPATGKVRYRDKHQAHDALKSAKRRRQWDNFVGVETRRREVRVYACPDCGGWHTTSLPTPPPTATIV